MQRASFYLGKEAFPKFLHEAGKTGKYLYEGRLKTGMASAIFFPLDLISPGQLIAEYSEWIYFALIMVFFMAFEVDPKNWTGC